MTFNLVTLKIDVEADAFHCDDTHVAEIRTERIR